VIVIVTVTVTLAVTDDDQRLVLHDGGSVQRAELSWSSIDSCTCVVRKKVSITIGSRLMLIISCLILSWLMMSWLMLSW
jgi:hypothetical protein